MSKYFRLTREGSGNLSARIEGADNATEKAAVRMKRNGGGPYRLFNFQTGKWSSQMTHKGAMGAIQTRLSANKIGDSERIKCANGNIIRARRVEPPSIDPPYDAAQLDALAEQFYRVCAEMDPSGEYWGGYNCRRASHNWSIWSTHAYGEAIDWHPSSMSMGDAIKRALLNKFPSRVTVVWRQSGHFDHVHAETIPSRQGTPCG